MSSDYLSGRLPTGVRNLDDLLEGGIPRGSVTVVAGPPGSGKTILTEQIAFRNATRETPALLFNTLSEPTAKTLQYLQSFSFFDRARMGNAIQFVDLGKLSREGGLAEAADLILAHVERVRPAIVAVDSFKVFDDLAASQGELRRFTYELAVHLMAWECTAFLLGEYSLDEFEVNPLFSVVDGLVVLTQQRVSGEQQRFLQVVKMRGTEHYRDEFPFVITSDGIEVFAPRVTIRRQPAEEGGGETQRLATGIPHLDDLLGPGIPLGSSLLVAGAAGTGKTVLSLEFVYRGALAGEKGIVISFEETRERLLATARGLGWDFDAQVERGRIEILFIPQPDVEVERDLLRIQDRIRTFEARRVAIDSVSVFLHKIRDAQVAREKVFHLATLVQNNQAVGFFTTDIPYGSQTLSRFGVEETVVDGVILLSLSMEALDRVRYLEVYKLRNTSHKEGRHAMAIGPDGVTLFPRYELEPDPVRAAATGGARVSSGLPALDALLGGGLRERSVTLLKGNAGIGKSTFGMQFVLEGVRSGEPAIFVALEEGPAQIVESARSIGLPLAEAVDRGLLDLVSLSRGEVRPSQLPAVLADRIRDVGARRIVLDGVGRLEDHGIDRRELGAVLHGLGVRFKGLGVTSVLTVECSEDLSSVESTSRSGLSPVADNLIVLRYHRSAGGLERTLTVLKVRASAHDLRTRRFTIGSGGIALGTEVEAEAIERGESPSRSAGA